MRGVAFRSVFVLLSSLAVLAVAETSRGTGSSQEAGILGANALMGERPERAEGPALAIDDSLLYLSPGDRLKLRWWGIGSGTEELVVNTRGEIVVPDLGVVHARGASFARVRDSIEGLVRKQIRVKMIDLQVLEIGRAQVMVTGLVPSPGILDVPAGTRLSEVLARTGLAPKESLRNMATSNPALPGERTARPSLRRILLVRGGRSDTVWCDLATAWNAASLKDDPPLFSGDRVRILPQGGAVALTGGGTANGYLEFLPGESLAAFLRAAGHDGSSTCEAVDEQGTRRRLGSADRLDSSIAVLELPFPRNRPLRNLVWILGTVAKPGGYVLKESMTTGDLLAMAGGALGGADSAVTMSVKRDWPSIQAGKRPGFEALSQYPEVRMAVFNYFHQMKGSYSSANALLQPGDTVMVNRAERVVWVAGQVLKPGFVPWVKGASAEDYVAAAGGFAPRAWEEKTVIFDLYTDQIVPVGGDIRAGSTVIVPEHRYLYFDQWITLGATVVSAVVSVVYLYVALGKN